MRKAMVICVIGLAPLFASVAGTAADDSLGPVFVLTGSMTTPRTGHTATLLNDGRVLIAGGYAVPWCDPPLQSAEIYDPTTRTFTSTGDMGAFRGNHVAVLLGDGKVLIAGGGGPWGDRAEVYDPANGTFTELGIIGLRPSTATLLNNGKVLLIEGSMAVIYDPSAKTFTMTGSPIVERHGHTATLLKDGRVLIAGGWSEATGGPHNRAEIYDPATGIFTETGDLACPRSGHTATLLASGKVFLAGGLYGCITTELYDPSTGVFSFVSGLNPGLSCAFTAMLLNDGNVLLVGGTNVGPEGMADAEIYDPGKAYDPLYDCLAHTCELNVGRAMHTATLLKNGDVLVVGGYNNEGGGDSHALSSAELYSLNVSTAIQSLSSLVAGFNLKQGIANSLDSKLQNALDAYEAANAGNRQDAANKLMAFINAVEAQRDQTITSEQADQLVAVARRILSVL